MATHSTTTKHDGTRRRGAQGPGWQGHACARRQVRQPRGVQGAPQHEARGSRRGQRRCAERPRVRGHLPTMRPKGATTPV